jgi:hypothetical protein
VVSVPFTVLQNSPTVLDVTGADGRVYRVTLFMGINQAVDLQQHNPISPGVPVFNFQMNVVANVEPLIKT